MNNNDRADFANMWTAVRDDIYGKQVSLAAMDMVFRSLERFELKDIERAIQLHINDTENGRFPIIPAHIVANIEGAGQERAAVAWNKFIGAAVNVGPHEDVVFDDPAIHAIIQNEGGWIKVCDFSDEDMKYMQNRFNKQYITYVTRREFDYPRLLAGITNAANTGKLDDEGKELKPKPPSIIGDKTRAGIVWKKGSVRTGQITHSHMVESIAKKLAAPETKNTN